MLVGYYQTSIQKLAYNQLTAYSDISQPAYLSAWLGYILNIRTLNTTGLFMLSSSDVHISLYDAASLTFYHVVQNFQSNLGR